VPSTTNHLQYLVVHNMKHIKSARYKRRTA